MVKLIGKSPINPILFISGKVSGYVTWIILVLYLIGFNFFQNSTPILLKYFAYLLLCLAVVIITLSLINLGDSISFGVPIEKTELKTKGLYKYSRNPMYTGFNILTISSILLTFNPIVLILGVYSIIVYHLIILGEEKYLMQKFGDSYTEYCRKIKRYI